MSDLTDLRQRVARRHHVIGWWGLLLFLSLGIGLEALHGFKAGFYLDPPNRIRQTMWRLAHAHGTLLSVVHIAFAAGLVNFGRWSTPRLKLASFFLLDALLLLPTGFFLGGLFPNETDPWLGVLLVPLGAVLAFIAVVLIAISATAAPEPPAE